MTGKTICLLLRFRIRTQEMWEYLISAHTQRWTSCRVSWWDGSCMGRLICCWTKEVLNSSNVDCDQCWFISILSLNTDLASLPWSDALNNSRMKYKGWAQAGRLSKTEVRFCSCSIALLHSSQLNLQDSFDSRVLLGVLEVVVLELARRRDR